MIIKKVLCRVLGRLGITKNHWPVCLLEYANMQLYKQKQGYTFNLDTPKLFTEKIQWQKTRFNRPDLVRYVDKYLFKDLIKEKLGGGDLRFRCMELGLVLMHSEKHGILYQESFV